MFRRVYGPTCWRRSPAASSTILQSMWSMGDVLLSLTSSSIEWENASDDSVLITDSLGNARAMPVDVSVEAQKSAVNRSLVFPEN